MLQVERKKRRKGRKWVKWAALGMAAMLCGLLAFFALRKTETMPTRTDTGGSIVNRETAEIRRIRIQIRGQEAWTAERDEDGELKITGAEGWVLDETLGERIEDALAHLVYEDILTENPEDYQGTYPLPEAQLDRFLMRLSLGHPTQEEAVAMMQRFLQNQPLDELTPVASREEVCEAAQLCRQCEVSVDVMRYMAALCEAARDPERVRLGPSPRALLALMRACQALAAIRGRSYVIPDDVKELAVPVLAHRIILRGISYQHNSETLVAELVAKVPVPTEERA